MYLCQLLYGKENFYLDLLLGRAFNNYQNSACQINLQFCFEVFGNRVFNQKTLPSWVLSFQ